MYFVLFADIDLATSFFFYDLFDFVIVYSIFMTVCLSRANKMTTAKFKNNSDSRNIFCFIKHESIKILNQSIFIFQKKKHYFLYFLDILNSKLHKLIKKKKKKKISFVERAQPIRKWNRIEIFRARLSQSFRSAVYATLFSNWLYYYYYYYYYNDDYFIYASL